MKVTGIVLLEPGHPELRNATLRVRLLDVSLLDAPSVTLAETAVRSVNQAAGEERAVPFALETDIDLPEGAELSVAAHLERTPTPRGAVRRGDLVTTRSYPVAATGAHGIVVRLTPVGPSADDE